MTDLKPSIRATYDSTETGPRYWVTATVNDEPINFQQPIPDPFVRQTVWVDRWTLLKALFGSRHLKVEVTVGGDVEVMNDVLELDDQTLVRDRTRNAAFRQSMHGKLAAFAAEEHDHG